MIRVYVIVEGETEESFIGGPLYGALIPYGVFVQPIVLGRPGHRGGRVNYQRVKNDVVKTLKQDKQACCSTLFDWYGLGHGFPTLPSDGSVFSKIEALEQAISKDIMQSIPEFRSESRFIPYIQLHEFEGLLFSDPSALAAGMFRKDLVFALQDIRDHFITPEEINDNPESAPSKRILKLDGGYDKVISGTLAAEQMGVDVIRRECPRFSIWFNKLAALGNNTGI